MDDNWNLVPENHLNMRPSVAISFGINKTLTVARESKTILKFQGKLQSREGRNSTKKLLLEQFYYIKSNFKVMNLLENYHMITMQNMIDVYKSRLVGGNLESLTVLN